MTDLTNDPLMKVSEVAQMFDVRPATVRVWLNTGKLKGTKPTGQWRVSQSAALAFANQEYGDNK